MKKLVMSLAVVPFIVGGVTTVQAEGLNIFNSVKVKGELRPRYEYVNQYSNGKEKGNSFTTRTTVGVSAGLLDVSGLSTYLEVTSVNNFGGDNYNSTNNGKTQYDLIVDPQNARATQAYVDYSMGKTLLRAGRQMVNLDDQRFVGAVGWRQMPQTFDAVALVDSSIENLTLLGAYVGGINNVKVIDQSIGTSSVLVNAKYKVMPELSVTAFGYLLADIHDTYGVKFNGKVTPMNGVSLTYNASYAIQSDASLDKDGKDEAPIDASFYTLSVGANISGVIVGGGYEVLGEANGDSVKGFTTPLATLHKWQGFADVFLGRTAGSNNNGLVDLSAKVGYKANGLGKFLLFFHTNVYR